MSNPEFEPQLEPPVVCLVCSDFMAKVELPINPDSQGWTEPVRDPEEIARLTESGEAAWATFYICPNCDWAVEETEYDDARDAI